MKNGAKSPPALFPSCCFFFLTPIITQQHLLLPRSVSQILQIPIYPTILFILRKELEAGTSGWEKQVQLWEAIGRTRSLGQKEKKQSKRTAGEVAVDFRIVTL